MKVKRTLSVTASAGLLEGGKFNHFQLTSVNLLVDDARQWFSGNYSNPVLVCEVS